MKKHLLKRVLSLGLTLGFFTTGLFGACDRKTGNGLEPEQEDIAVSSVKAVGSLSATDALGREVSPVAYFNDSRQVGVFYFLWIGEHGSTGAEKDGHTLDVSRLSEEEIKSRSDIGRHHYWNEPLYGYYRSDDPWFFRKHLELLTFAGVDYLVFDYTNSTYGTDQETGEIYPVNYYKDVTDALFPVALEMREQGWDIPKFVFMLNNASDKTVKFLYEDYYTNAAYDSLWYREKDGLKRDKNTEGKPWVICGDVSFLEEEVKDYFYIKRTQWPNEAAGSDGWDYAYRDDGFPWMSWERVKDGKRRQYSHNGIISVSIAQHVAGAFSDAVLIENNYNANYGRGWLSLDNGGYGANNKSRVAAGTNFQEQWDYAVAEAEKGNVNNVFVTGWNEWVAQKQPAEAGNRPTSYLVDLYDDEFSRDAEMSKGELGDNYYLQLVENIRRFKGVSASSAALKIPEKKIDLAGGLDQWNGIAGYADFAGDTAFRDHASSNASLANYVDKTGRNDIVNTRIAWDGESIFLLVTCADAITPYEAGDKTWMNLFFGVSTEQESGWNGFQYVVNRTVSGSTSSVERLSEAGEAAGKTGEAELSVFGRYLVVRIPRSALGLTEKKFTLRFKVSDHVVHYADIMSYYAEGDAAPIGRFAYTAKNG